MIGVKNTVDKPASHLMMGRIVAAHARSTPCPDAESIAGAWERRSPTFQLTVAVAGRPQPARVRTHQPNDSAPTPIYMPRAASIRRFTKRHSSSGATPPWPDTADGTGSPTRHSTTMAKSSARYRHRGQRNRSPSVTGADTPAQPSLLMVSKLRPYGRIKEHHMRPCRPYRIFLLHVHHINKKLTVKAHTTIFMVHIHEEDSVLFVSRHPFGKFRIVPCAQKAVRDVQSLLIRA